MPRLEPMAPLSAPVPGWVSPGSFWEQEDTYADEHDNENGEGDRAEKGSELFLSTEDVFPWPAARAGQLKGDRSNFGRLGR